MDYQAIVARDKAYVAQTYGRFDVALVRGEGARCWDANGKEYLDMTSGIGVNALGFCDPQWAKAIYAQLTTLQHTSNLYYTEPCGEVAETLCRRAGMRSVFFANSGAESNEGAIKCARKYGHAHHGPACHNILTLNQSFHGRTITTLAATGQDAFHQQFDPFTAGFAYAPANDFEKTAAMMDGNTCAVMIEMVQGEGGVLPLDQSYVSKLAALCAERDILLIVDEVQTGIGRTGTLFAFEQFGIHPDIVTCAKGLGGGLPVGAVLFGEKTHGVLAPGEHATTFGGGPAICAGAMAVLTRIDDLFLAGVRAKADYLRSRLEKMPHVTSVDGMGLMLGATLEGVAARDVVLKGIEAGVLMLTAKDRLRLLPPLSITDAELDAALSRIETTMKEVSPA